MAKDAKDTKTKPKMARREARREATTTDATAATSAAEAGADGGADREKGIAAARERLGVIGRNDPCSCGSGKKYKKCHLVADEAATAAPPEAPDAKKLVAAAWGLFEQRRPGAAEREFRAALALEPGLVDARVGIGMARLSANDVEAARVELDAVVAGAEPEFAKMREDKVKDAFTRPEVQPLIRAAHALGCLAYDQERYADALTDLERVFSIDEGAVGTEARLIAAKSLMKQEKPGDAVAVLKPATASETGASRAQMGLALAHFAAGSPAEAEASLTAALEANPHFAKAVLGRVRRRVENLAGTQPGSLEEALVYAQTYGDVWTDDAKKLLASALDEGAAKKKVAASETPATVAG